MDKKLPLLWGVVVVRKGIWRGCQRWFCKACNRYFSGKDPLCPHRLYEQYLTGNKPYNN